MNFEEARAQFPVLEKLAYLNAGTFGPIARTTHDAIVRELDRDYRDGRSGGPNFARVMELRDQLRQSIAALVGAEPAQVALTTSTTDGCNIVLGGLGLGPDDEIVTTTDEHFGLLGALATSGARVVVVSPDPDSIRAAVTSRTRLLALSQVIWTTGRILPVRELRQETGIPILVDGAQSVGAIPVSAVGLDYLTISGQKWLCGPDATGALVVTDPDRLGISAPSYFSQADYEPGRAVPAEARRSPLRPRLVAAVVSRGPARGSRESPVVGLRPRCRGRRALPRPPRQPSRGGQPGRRRALDPRRLPSRRRARPRSSRRSITPTSTCARFRAPV